MDERPYYETAKAAEYLTDHLGVRTAPQTLAKYRSIGGGPKFRHFGRFPKYREDWLDEWADRRISVPKRSTSEAA